MCENHVRRQLMKKLSFSFSFSFFFSLFCLSCFGVFRQQKLPYFIFPFDLGAHEWALAHGLDAHKQNQLIYRQNKILSIPNYVMKKQPALAYFNNHMTHNKIEISSRSKRFVSGTALRRFLGKSIELLFILFSLQIVRYLFSCKNTRTARTYI